MAFTLAEVLITLGIIGVVAAMTIPNLISSYQEKIIVNRLKQSYSILNQAYKLASEEYGPISTWNPNGPASLTPQDIIDHLTPFLKSFSVCDGLTTSSCRGTVATYDLLGVQVDNIVGYNIIIANTTKISLGAYGDGHVHTYFINSADCDSGCFMHPTYTDMSAARVMIVNVTGSTKPRYGKDIFLFAILDKGIIPLGVIGRGTCNPTKASTPGWWSGATCAGYVIKHGNLDYLKCVKGNQKYCTGNYIP